MFDVDANHVRGRLNQYVIKVDDKRIALLPLPPETESEVDIPNLLIQSKGNFLRELQAEM